MNRTIFIVDDDILITSTLATLLEMSLDYNVVTFNNPVDALNSDMLSSGGVDLIISDFLMPEMNGLDFLRKAKDIDPKIIAIILTGYADKQNAIRFINELGIYYYLEKPWDNDALIRIIENGIEKKRLEKELEKKLLELEDSNKELSGLYSLLRNDYNKEISKVEALNEWNKTLEAAVRRSTSSLRNLLDNAGQGFLTFGADLAVHKEYSQECSNIFSGAIEGRSFSELVFPGDKSQQDFLGTLVPKLFEEAAAEKSEILLSLLPDELYINDKYISICYKLVEHQDNPEGEVSKAVMAILTDITEKRSLEIKMDEEQGILRMIVKAVTNRSDYLYCINSYRDFCRNKIDEILYSAMCLDDILYEIFRSIHNFKGNFSQLDFINITKKLHAFESQLSDLKNNPVDITFERLKQLINSDDMYNWLDKDMELLDSYLGKDFSSQRNLLNVDKTKLVDLEKKLISKLSPSDYKLFLPELRKLRYVPFRDLLKSYTAYIERLSDSLEKPVHQFTIEGGNFLVDPDRYGDFAKALVHVFRNIMDHGLESPEEREAMGKDYFGKISCRIENAKGTVSIRIADDGRGLDPHLIAEKALKKGLINRDDIKKINPEEVIYLILKDGFSTKDEVTELSGRGMGLSSVNKEVTRLNGTIKINTKPGSGTEFNFRLPLQEASDLEEIPVSSIMNPLINSLKRYVFDLTGINLSSRCNYSLEKPDRLQLRNTTAVISVKGALRGRFVVTLDELLIKKVVNSFVIESIGDDEAALYYEDVLAECLNTILGNSIKLFPGLENLVAISAPSTISAEKAYLRCPESDTWTCNMESGAGNLSLSFIAADSSSII